MNGLVNKVQLIGHLGADVEVINFESGNKKANIRLATSEVWRDANGEKKEETQWHNVVAWGKLADILQKYTKKGSEIMIEGKLKYRSYETKENEKRYVTEIEVKELMLMGSPKSNENITTNNQVTYKVAEPALVDDVLPF
jgi:single-strand DNA-binding protein